MGGAKLKWHQLAHLQLMSQQRPHFSPHRKAKANDKKPNLRKIGSGISHVAFASVLEKWLLQGERDHSSYFRCFQKQNREEGKTE